MAREVHPRQIEIYKDEDGKEPYFNWIASFRDKRTQVRIVRRVQRMSSGNFGDHKSVGEGVFELRLFFGSGYRVYFAEDGDTIVVLLCGGDKSSQAGDIEWAKTYWKKYKQRKKRARL